MSDKEILQENNTNLNENNEELNTILEDINKLPSAIVKPETFTEGNIPQFDSDGNVIDSGKSVANVGGGINPNLLDNWYFSNPVNRNGQTEYVSSDAINTLFTIDRCFVHGGTSFTISALGISSSTNKCIYQHLNMSIDYITGKTVTLSALTDKSLISVTGFVNKTIAGEIYLEFNSDEGYLVLQDSLRFYPNLEVGIASNPDSPIVLKAVKLELGDTQTLAHEENGTWVLNEIPNYAEQMAICSQYHPTTGAYIGLPSHTYDTEDLEAGVSTLPAGMVYYQYE